MDSMKEKMTVSMFALIHGEDDALAECETWEADTREELAAQYLKFLQDLVKGLVGLKK